MSTTIPVPNGDVNQARPVTTVSVTPNWVSLGDFKTADTDLATVMLTNAGAHVLDPASGTYLALHALCTNATVGTAPVIQVFGVDGNGVVQLLRSVTDNASATFGASPVAVTGTSLYVIPETKVGDFLFDLRGAVKVIVKVLTAGVSAGTITGYAKFL